MSVVLRWEQTANPRVIALMAGEIICAAVLSSVRDQLVGEEEYFLDIHLENPSPTKEETKWFKKRRAARNHAVNRTLQWFRKAGVRGIKNPGHPDWILEQENFSLYSLGTMT